MELGGFAFDVLVVLIETNGAVGVWPDRIVEDKICTLCRPV